MFKRFQLLLIALMLVSIGIFSMGYDSIDDPRVETYFEGYITDADTGDPLVDGYVKVFGSQSAVVAFVDEEGYYRVDVTGGQTYYLYAYAEGYLDGYDESEIEKGENIRIDFELILRNFSSVVYGKVYDMETEEPVEARVSIYNFDTDYSSVQNTEGSGGFRFEVDPGTCAINVDPHSDQYEPYYGSSFEVGEGEEVEKNFGVKRIGQTVHGFVTDERGEPMEGAYVSLESVPGEDAYGNNYYGIYTDADGYYCLYPRHDEYWIECHANLQEPYQDVIEIEEGEEVRYDIEMEPAIPSLLYRLIRFILDLIPQTY